MSEEDSEPKSSIEEDIKAFFEMKAETPKKKKSEGEDVKKSFNCPFCGNVLSTDVNRCECGAEFQDEDVQVEAEITEFFDELHRVKSDKTAAELEAEALEKLEHEESVPEGAETEAGIEPEAEVIEELGVEEELEVLEPEEELEAEAEIEEEVEVEAKVVTRERVRRDRILFYTGSSLLLLGGPLIALSSWLHDWFRVPIIGDTYDAFGWLNVYFAMIGFIIFFVGLVLFVISLRGGVITNKKLKELKAEG